MSGVVRCSFVASGVYLYCKLFICSVKCSQGIICSARCNQFICSVMCSQVSFVVLCVYLQCQVQPGVHLQGMCCLCVVVSYRSSARHIQVYQHWVRGQGMQPFPHISAYCRCQELQRYPPLMQLHYIFGEAWEYEGNGLRKSSFLYPPCLVWCTQNAPKRQQFHVAPAMSAL